MEIALVDAVAAVRQELLEAVQRGAGQEIAFAVGPIEMEFAIELRTDAKAKVGLKAWVISGDADAGISRANTHRVKVALTPKRPDGTDLLISTASGQGDRLRTDPGHLGR